MNLQSWILPGLIILFFIFKILKTKKFKKDLPELMSRGAVIIDVRSPNEFMSSHNPNSLNIPLDTLSSKSDDLDKNQVYILCCASGARSAAAMGIMKSKGFKQVMNAGSWKATLI